MKKIIEMNNLCPGRFLLEIPYANAAVTIRLSSVPTTARKIVTWKERYMRDAPPNRTLYASRLQCSGVKLKPVER